jgi:hypothetical protein
LKKILMIGALVFAATTVAETANAAEFYVVRDSTTRKCTIVDTKPMTTTTTVVDNGTFKTRTESRNRHEDHEGLHHQLRDQRLLKGGEAAAPFG